MLNDTLPEADTVLTQLFHEAPDWKKIKMVNEMTKTVYLLAETGVRDRYPDAGEAEVRRRLADVVLGEDLAEKVYGKLAVENCD